MASAITSKRHPLQVNEQMYQSVREIAKASNISMTKVVECAVEQYRREILLRTHNEAWARPKETDPDAVASFDQENELWERTTEDGLDTRGTFACQ